MKLALLAMDLWRFAHRHHCSLDRNRAAAAHRVHECLATVVPRHDENRGGKRFFEWRRMTLLAITTLVQRLARGVEAQHTASVPQMSHDDHLWLTSIDDRRDALFAFEDVANTLAHLRDDLLRRHPTLVGIVTLAFDHEAMTRLEQLGPMNAPDL